MTCSYETERIAEDRDRLAHNPEVAGSNPVPATSGNGPRRLLRGPFFMPDGNTFGNISGGNECVCGSVLSDRTAVGRLSSDRQPRESRDGAGNTRT